MGSTDSWFFVKLCWSLFCFLKIWKYQVSQKFSIAKLSLDSASIAALFLSALVRSLRWRLLLISIKPVELKSLFASYIDRKFWKFRFAIQNGRGFKRVLYFDLKKYKDPNSAWLDCS